MAAVSRGKKVIVGANETTVVANHDFCKILIIPDAVLIHDVPEPDNCEHQISLNDMDKTSEDESAVVTVNPKFKEFKIQLTEIYKDSGG